MTLNFKKDMKKFALKKIFFTIIFSLLLIGNISNKNVSPIDNVKKIKARITYYYAEAPWWKQVACPKTQEAKVGVTIAAHPDFKFGTKIFIPGLKERVGDGHFIVQDRGGAVTKKTAARGKGYVFDVFIQKNEYKELMCNAPTWMDVYVF